MGVLIYSYVVPYFTSGSTRTSSVIVDLHSGHSGSWLKLNDSLIQPLHSSLVHAQIFVSTSGTGSFGPLEKDMTASPFIVVLPLYSFFESNERDHGITWQQPYSTKCSIAFATP